MIEGRFKNIGLKLCELQKFEKKYANCTLLVEEIETEVM